MRIIRLFFRWWADDANHGAGVSAQFGELQHKALREPIEITRHGRREFVLLSADHYDWPRRPARTHRSEDTAVVVIDYKQEYQMG